MRTIRSAAKWTADAVGLVQLIYPRHFLAVFVLIWFDNRHKRRFSWRLSPSKKPLHLFQSFLHHYLCIHRIVSRVEELQGEDDLPALGLEDVSNLLHWRRTVAWHDPILVLLLGAWDVGGEVIHVKDVHRMPVEHLHALEAGSPAEKVIDVCQNLGVFVVRSCSHCHRLAEVMKRGKSSPKLQLWHDAGLSPEFQ